MTIARSYIGYSMDKSWNANDFHATNIRLIIFFCKTATVHIVFEYFLQYQIYLMFRDTKWIIYLEGNYHTSKYKYVASLIYFKTVKCKNLVTIATLITLLKCKI